MKSKPTRKLPTNDSNSKPTTAEIAAAAYQLYVDSGYQDGHDQEHWLLAERLLAKKDNLSAKAASPSQTISSTWSAKASPRTAAPAVPR